MMNHTQSTLLVVLCTIAPLCWSAEQTLTEKLQSAVHSGGKILYTGAKSTVPVILVDPVEREAQLKELRSMTKTEMAVPIVTGAVSGVVYGICAAYLAGTYDSASVREGKFVHSIATTIAAGVGVKMAKTLLFGYLHPKEAKRGAVNSLDMMAAAVVFTGINVL